MLNMFNIARRPPDGLPMRPRQPIPGREPIHIGRADSSGAQSRRRIGSCEAGIIFLVVFIRSGRGFEMPEARLGVTSLCRVWQFLLTRTDVGRF